jgi:hypothetical protein
MRSARKILTGKPEREDHSRYRRRWEDNVKMDVRAVYENVDWILLVRDRGTWRTDMNAQMKLSIR